MLNEMNIPITELSGKEDIEHRFLEMLGDAQDAAAKRISCSLRYRKFFEGDQHNVGGSGFGWLNGLRDPANLHIPRMSGEETFESITDVLPILLKSRPGLAVEPEERTEDPETAFIAEVMTDIYDNIRRIRSQHVFESDVVLESLISGIAFVTFQKIYDHRGITVQPKLLMPEQFLGDPDGCHAYNFDDYQHIILTSYRTPYEIKADYGYDEDDYGANTTIQNTKTMAFMGVSLPTLRQKKRNGAIEGRYPVHTLFVRPYTASLDAALELQEAPMMQKMTFINESFYVEGSKVDNPYWHKDFPVTAFQSLPKPYHEVGTSDVAVLMSTQIAINIARDSSVAVALYNASPGYLTEDGVVGKGKIDDGPGGVTEVNSGGLVRGEIKEKNPRDSASSMNLWTLTKQQMRERKGDAGNLLQGGQPGNIKSGKQYAMSLNNVLTRNGYRVSMLDASWQRFATQDISLFQQFVTFKSSFLSKAYEIAEEFQYMTDLDIAERIRAFPYDINIHSKMDLPATTEEKLNLFLALYDRGLVSPQEFYEQTGIVLSPEEREKIELSSATFVPGIPAGETAAMGLQASAQADQLVGEM